MGATTRGLDWLAVAAADADALGAYYRDTLGLTPADPAGGVAGPPPAHAFATPPGRLCVRPLTVEPSGGVHTHFAIAVTPERYDRLHGRLAAAGPVVERTFGGRRSLYRTDPAGHCVEFGERPGLEASVGPVFEVVLEVADLDRALGRYAPLGFEPLGADGDRPRRRLRGPFDLELWEPHLGIADARGGCHVDLGLTADDPEAAARRLAPDGRAPRAVDDRWFVRDGDGHTWWFAPDG